MVKDRENSSFVQERNMGKQLAHHSSSGFYFPMDICLNALQHFITLVSIIVHVQLNLITDFMDKIHGGGRENGILLTLQATLDYV